MCSTKEVSAAPRQLNKHLLGGNKHHTWWVLELMIPLLKSPPEHAVLEQWYRTGSRGSVDSLGLAGWFFVRQPDGS